MGNLPYQATEEQVRDMFEPYGEVRSVAMISDRDTGRFRGFCFVEMDDAAADKAIAALNNRDVEGRQLRVNEARPREERSGGQGGQRRGGRSGDDRGNRRDFGSGSGGGRGDFPHSGGSTRGRRRRDD